MSHRRLAPLGALLIALAGCGATADEAPELQGEEARVAQVIADVQEAAGEDAQERICRQLVTAELARMAGDCPAAVRAAIAEADVNAQAVEDVRITGATATARVETGERDPQVETIRFQRVGRDWRIAGFG